MFAQLSKKALFGDAFWALSGSVVSALALLVGTRLLTELVTPAVYGQIALLNGLVALGVSAFSYPFICAGMRLTPECWNQRERTRLYKTVADLAARSTLLAMILLVTVGAGLAYYNGGDFKLFILTGALLATTVRRELGIQLLIGERKQRLASLWQTLDGILRPSLAIALAGWLGRQAEYVLLGYILASLLATLLGSIGQRAATPRYRYLPDSDRNFRQAVWSYALPLIPMELIFWLNGLGDRYVIGHLLSAADVGLYAAVYTIVNEAFNRSAMILLRVFQPVYFQSHAQDRAREGFSILWLWIACVLGLGVIGVAAVLMLRDWLAALVLAKSYHAAAALMPPIAIGVALHTLGTVLAQPLLAQKRTRLLLLGRAAGALTAAVSIPLMVSHYGLPGAAMANPIYFGVEALVLAILAQPWRGMRNATATARNESLNVEATA